MTAEIAVMNRQAVALAADSAVTVNHPKGQKVYNSVSKLFTLSRYAPVGIMICGVADLTGVPWETIIKSYRRELDRKRFPHLRDYAVDLIRYVKRHRIMFSEEQQRQQFTVSVMLQFRSILRNIERRIRAHIEEHGGIADAQVKRIVDSSIRSHHSKWMNAEALAGVPRDHASRIRRKWREEILAVRDFTFEKLPIGNASTARLIEIAGRVFSANLFPDNVSGVVVAGFGVDEYFPSLVSYDTEGVLLNAIKVREGQSVDVRTANEAAIVPFAQKEMVHLFMEGIDPILRTRIMSELESVAGGLPDALIKALRATGRREQVIRRQVTTASNALRKEFTKQIEDWILARHVAPVVMAVENLPKEELASMAESLVSLTSFKRRVTQDPETVGGPIDVAVISKGDGFVWIQRKHYFDPLLNHQFFANYFGGGGRSG